MAYQSNYTGDEVVELLEKIPELEKNTAKTLVISDNNVYVQADGITNEGNYLYALPNKANGNEDDVLATKNNLKTINGESIFGKGNIEVKGSGGAEYDDTEIKDQLRILKSTKIDSIDGGEYDQNKYALADGLVSNYKEDNGDFIIYALPDKADGSEHDTLVSRDTLKTINGEVIYGQGDIKIDVASFINNDSLQGLPFGYYGGTYSSYFLPGDYYPTEEIDIGYVTDFYYGNIAISLNDKLFEFKISDLSGEGQNVGIGKIRYADTHLYYKVYSPVSTTIGWRTFIGRINLPSDWVEGRSYDDTELKKDINTKLSGKVDKVAGKGLSTYDFNSHWQEKIDRSENAPFWTLWEELRDMRDNGELIAGRLYRIIDYVTTTTQENTRSAEHRFDLIVLALSENTLSEEAYAIYSDEDSYFADNGANLSAWKIWYCLDNDRERFAWADEENGRGVIYRMIDEWGNDCPYDFKNIQFKRNLNFDEGYAQLSEDGDETWVYTFAGQSYHINNDEYSEMLDGSLESPFGHMSDEGGHTFHDNIIKPYIKVYDEVDELRENCGLRYLNNIIFFGYWEEIGSSDDEYTYYYAYCCWNNRMGYGCYSNTFGNSCGNNTFGNGCYNNTFGNDCSSNSFGNGCYKNSFDNYCYNNSFANDCHHNTFGNNCSNNTFGNDCHSNSFGNGCYNNSFGSNCGYNSFGNSCHSNSFGNSCYKNSFTDDGDGSSQHIKGLAHNVTHCLYDDGVHDVTMYYDDISDAYESINNIHIYRGVHNVSYTPQADTEIEQSFCCNHQGDIVPFILFDIITKVNDL